MVVVQVSTGFFRWIGGVFSMVGARERAMTKRRLPPSNAVWLLFGGLVPPR